MSWNPHKDAPDLALACFGSAVAHHPASPECSGCPYLADCGSIAEATRRRLEKELGLDNLSPTIKKPKRAVTPSTSSASASPASAKRETLKKADDKPMPAINMTGLSVRTVAFVKPVLLARIDIEAALRLRTNPFSLGSSLGHWHVALDMLFAGNFARGDLIAALQSRCGVDLAGAQARADAIIQLFIHLNAAVERDGRIFLSE
ncbi:hypothetical protein [Magnetospirillum molischianum]|uniref:Uncharacterized protein n=1 Tax=Magnetospirillum molischianum DSM 120 TaxID=1150626 RepID=H8FY90_MAGML|nr:hypothetical protein [Magnetospirillum molischianum]CCG43328.1 hypothetical protein PHAMO_80119 [Magnetospirillum molischianum DSM 120]